MFQVAFAIMAGEYATCCCHVSASRCRLFLAKRLPQFVPDEGEQEKNGLQNHDAGAGGGVEVVAEQGAGEAGEHGGGDHDDHHAFKAFGKQEGGDAG